MSGGRLPRELRYTINRLAHERAQRIGRSFGYRRRYAEEKASLYALVVTWLAAGDTQEHALAKLQGGRDSARSQVRETVKALLQQLKSMD